MRMPVAEAMPQSYVGVFTASISRSSARQLAYSNWACHFPWSA